MINIEKGQIWLVKIGMIGGEFLCRIKNPDFRDGDFIIVIERLDKDIQHYIGKNGLLKYLGRDLEDAKKLNSAYMI